MMASSKVEHRPQEANRREEDGQRRETRVEIDVKKGNVPAANLRPEVTSG